MMSSRLKQLALAITLVVFVGSSFVVAQPPGGGGDRRGGDRRGGDRRGGPPGGGRFGGGGDRGGGDRGGGDRGGRGFDPSAMLRRLDRNGDGTLSPDETEGRARGFIERFVPGADLSKPITIEKLGRQVQDARADRERNSRRGNDEDEGPEPLVPGFEIEFELPPVLGFGVSDSYFDVKTNDDDRDEARQLLRRYDRNRDGKLSREEVNRARWRDDPWQYDQNKDSVITEYELMVRFALRRQSREGDRDRNDRRRDNDDERRREKDRKQPQEDDRGSYRFATAHERLPKATPDWFIEKDFNKDGQVMMFEYASKWDEETAGEFDKWDLNRDGVIVPREAINAPSDDNDDAIASRPNGDKGGNSKDEPRKIDNSKAERYRKYAASVIKKYDENGDGQLSEKEYSKMRRPPKDADRDGNKRITLDELTEHTLKM